MTILQTKTASYVAATWAERETETADRNSERLLNWKMRAFRDVVDVPEAQPDPDRWPAKRASMGNLINVIETREAA